MAGIGVRLKRIYEKQTLVAHLVGFAYSIMVTIAPMLVVIGTVMLMSIVLGYDQVGYARRGLFAGTILYIFIFSLFVGLFKIFFRKVNCSSIIVIAKI